MLHSTVTTNGQTTLLGEVLQALNISPGATLEYELAGDHVTVRVLGAVHPLHGARQ
ncbi:MAG TPA: AbrB/MazE/SpoVT family DNA-binding domain-containing protein [Pirellulales bacterium]|nr:AbrB/MazE/SpoVT family DNA-binding domain-containing protein [Pirellulales bacterium]